jgi:hypothetical protein
MGHRRLRADPAWVRSIGSIGSIGRYKSSAPYAPYAVDSSLIQLPALESVSKVMKRERSDARAA